MTVLSASSLYPVVHDIDEDEYACCCVDGTVMMERFSLQELSLRPRAKQPTSNGSIKHSKRILFKTKRRCRSSLTRARNEGALMDSDSQTISTEAEERPKFEDAYVLTQQIFRCHSSVLWECVHRQSGQRYCVKIFDRRGLSGQQDEEAVNQEVALLEFAQDDATAIVKLVEIIDETEKMYLVMQLLTGGNLLSRVVQQEGLPEHTVKRIAKSLLSGASHLNRLQISHNGFEPSNILLDGADEAKIGDFGHASRIGTKPARQGNSTYAAPEVLQGVAPTHASDMWSIGVLLYFCLFGHTPFVDQAAVASSNRTVLSRVHKAEFSFPATERNHVSRYAKQLISGLIHMDPSVRLTAEEALEHQWLAEPVDKPLPFRHCSRPRRVGTLVRCAWQKLFLCRKKMEHKVLTNLSTNSSSPFSEYPLQQQQQQQQQRSSHFYDIATD